MMATFPAQFKPHFNTKVPREHPSLPCHPTAIYRDKTARSWLHPLLPADARDHQADYWWSQVGICTLWSVRRHHHHVTTPSRHEGPARPVWTEGCQAPSTESTSPAQALRLWLPCLSSFVVAVQPVGQPVGSTVHSGSCGSGNVPAWQVAAGFGNSVVPRSWANCG
jgi:hypothetical protein